MKRISQKEINEIIEQYNYICSTIRAMQQENERIITLNTINDYITILKDERITKNQNNNICYALVYTICNELEEYENNNNFVNFYNWAINNGYNDNLTLDRVNVNGNYEPINCKWSTKMEQANNRRNNVIVFYNERYLTLKELSELLNVNYRTINKQKLRGWTIEKILKKAGVNDENLLLHSRFL